MTHAHDETPAQAMQQLLDIMQRLRDPQSGCPWDIEQDFHTIAPYTIEEAYEVADAVTRQNWPDLRDELGDLLLQTVFHAQIAADRGLFDFADVVKSVSDKMIVRHPHVFGDQANDFDANEQINRWEAMKAAEREAKQETRVLDGVALGLPALMRAYKLQKRAARVGFDWPQTIQVLDKITEEAQELAEAAAGKDPDRIEDEAGDLLFAVTNLVRHLGVDPEAALRRTNDKFQRRFNVIEDYAKASDQQLADMSLEDMERAWVRAKQAERSS